MIRFKLGTILKELQISQTKFALMANVRPNTINDMCNGVTRRIEVNTLNCILKTLNHISEKKVKVEDLIFYVGDD